MSEIRIDDVFLIITVYVGMILAAFWLAMIIWAYRDMRARSRDSLAQILVVLLVAFLTVPGLLIYIFLRPRETLADAYERSLEEEALLQEIEEKPSCPACGQRVEASWQACPYCRTRLKKPCVHCRQALELSWDLCPYCATSQNPVAEVPASSSYVPLWDEQSYMKHNSQPAVQQASESLEFIDGDDFQ